MKTEWIGHVMLPFDLIGNFVDLMSYIRLFAVGTASLAVAQAFNGMVGFNSFFAGLFAAFVLFVGHSLNIILAFMGVLVHGIRLNALEFSNQMGLEWAGYAYQPFEKKTTTGNGSENNSQTAVDTKTLDKENS
jgi:V/A-type H+-transporting ATPase subunit I